MLATCRDELSYMYAPALNGVAQVRGEAVESVERESHPCNPVTAGAFHVNGRGAASPGADSLGQVQFSM